MFKPKVVLQKYLDIRQNLATALQELKDEHVKEAGAALQGDNWKIKIVDGLDAIFVAKKIMQAYDATLTETNVREFIDEKVDPQLSLQAFFCVSQEDVARGRVQAIITAFSKLGDNNEGELASIIQRIKPKPKPKLNF